MTTKEERELMDRVYRYDMLSAEARLKGNTLVEETAKELADRFMKKLQRR